MVQRKLPFKFYVVFFFGSCLFLFKCWYITNFSYNNICNYQTLYDTCTNFSCSSPTFQNVAGARYTKWFTENFLKVKALQICIFKKILNSNLIHTVLTWLSKSQIPKIITIWVPTKLYFPLSFKNWKISWVNL